MSMIKCIGILNLHPVWKTGVGRIDVPGRLCNTWVLSSFTYRISCTFILQNVLTEEVHLRALWCKIWVFCYNETQKRRNECMNTLFRWKEARCANYTKSQSFTEKGQNWPKWSKLLGMNFKSSVHVILMWKTHLLNRMGL